MRIALLSYEYPPETGFGGIGTYTYQHAHALARLGHEVHVFAGTTRPERRTYRDGAVTVTRFRADGFFERLMPAVPRHGLWWFQNRLQTAANAFRAVSRQLRDGSFDVVEMPECGADGALLTQLFDLPAIVRLHSPAELIMPSYGTRKLDHWLTSLVERLSLSGAKAITSCSRWLAAEVAQRMGVTQPIEVIPNGIDLGLFDEAEGVDIRAEFGIPVDATAIFFANRLEVRKGIDVVRQLVAELLPAEAQAVLVLAGGDHAGVFASDLVPLARTHGVEARLLHIGHHEPGKIRACLKQTDIFLLPSRWENAPFSLLEAMAASRATVASDCGGIPEILRHETDGLIVPTGDGSAFARALQRLVKDPGLRRRFGESARQRVENRFTSDATARRSAEFYRWAVAPARSVAPAGGGARARAETPVGPANWYQVWWLRGLGPGTRPSIECGADGRALLALLPTAELSFVHRVLTRTYRLRHGYPHPEEAAFLARLDELLRERAAAGDLHSAPDEASSLFGMPGLTHPLFADDALLEHFMAEIWRLRDWPGLQAWLVRETAHDRFVEAALASPLLRLIAIEAAIQHPDPETWRRLAAIYRNDRTQARVLEADRRYIETGEHGSWLQAGIQELGLHAPVRRPRALTAAKRRKATRNQSAAAGTVTVLVLALEHDEHAAAAIRSAAAQAGAGVELVVVTNADAAGVAEIPRSLDHARLELHRIEPGLGLGSSLVAALARVNSEYVAVLQSDDVFHPERLAACISTLEQDPVALLVATELAPMDDHERLSDSTHASALEVGKPLWEWLQRFTRTRAAGLSDRDLVATLLCGSHLPNSSNVVARTGFLREVAPLLLDLDGSVGWLLFLLAADRAGLRVIDRVLLGYRVRERSEIAASRHSQARRTLEAELAFTRFVSQKLRAAVAGGDAGAAMRSVARWIDTALSGQQAERRKLALAAMLAHAGVPFATPYEPDGDPPRRERPPFPCWGIGNWHGAADPLASAAIAAEAWIPFARRLAVESDRLREQLVGSADVVADEKELRDRVDARQTRVEQLEDELADLARREAQQRQELTERHRAELRELEQRLRANVDAERTQLLSLVEQERAQVAGELQAHREAERQLRERHAAQLEDLRAWIRRLRLDSVQAQQRLLDTLEMRFGRFLLDRLRLRGPVRSAQRFARRATLRIDRAMAGWRRKSGLRIGLLVDGRFPLDATLEAAWEAMALAEAGFDVHVLTWHKFDRRELGSFAGRAHVHVHRLAEDPRLARADLRKLRRAGVRVEGLDPGAVHIAATLRAIRADLVQAHGLGAAATAAQAAKAALGMPMVLRVTTADLPSLAGQQSALRSVLRDADMITADGGSTASALHSLAGGPLESLHVRGAILPTRGQGAAPAPTGAPVIALLEAAGNIPTLTTIETALSNLRAARLDEGCRIVVVGEPCIDDRAIERRERLAGVILSAGLDPALVFVGPATPRRLEEIAAGGSILLTETPHSDDPIWTASTGGAIAAGMQVISIANGLVAGVELRDGRAPWTETSSTHLKAAVTELASDNDRWARMATAAQVELRTIMARSAGRYAGLLRSCLAH